MGVEKGGMIQAQGTHKPRKEARRFGEGQKAACVLIWRWHKEEYGEMRWKGSLKTDCGGPGT